MKLPEPAGTIQSIDAFSLVGVAMPVMPPVGTHLFTEAQMREALASHEVEHEANERNLCQLTDELAESRREVAQLQEQNTYLDKVASELQGMCDRQAKKLEMLPASPVFHTGDAAVAYLHGHKQAADKYEAVMRMALKCLKNSNAVSFDDLHAIKALEEQLK